MAQSLDDITGQVAPARNADFILLSRLGIDTGGRTIYMRSDAAAALKRMADDFEAYKAAFNTGAGKKTGRTVRISFQAISGFRSFDDQKGIWDAKWIGKRKSNGVSLASIADPAKRGRAILEYSSMPGTSRHHWGTDVDLNSLVNSFFDTGDGKFLLDWLTANAPRYGFQRPYTAGRTGGYNEERWHWSYVPRASVFHALWNAEYRKNPRFFVRKPFEGSAVVAGFAPEYVNTVNPACMGK